MVKKLKNIIYFLSESLVDDEKRIKLQFSLVYFIIMMVSLFMTVVNIITAKTLLTMITTTFSALCLLNLVLAKCGEKWLKLSSMIFAIEFLALITYFIVSGSPEGFSAIWACFLPASGLLLYRRKVGTVFCTFMLLIMLFLFYTPIGNSFLGYPYTDSFKLRFPMLYSAFFAVSFFLETIRAKTHAKLKNTQKKYEFLYNHDALTKLYNRYGFDVLINKLIRKNFQLSVALLLIDIDHFKRINDLYGHVNGDIVLQSVAKLLIDNMDKDTRACRWGGEEFAVLFRNASAAEKGAKELHKLISETPIKIENDNINITVSMGLVVAAQNSGATQDSLMRKADSCLYQAKENGRNKIVCKYILRKPE